MTAAPDKKRILCVEDDADTCRLISAVLPDYDIRSTATVADAWKLYNSEKYSLVVVDYRLADGDGIELCERIRARDYLTPVIFITGYSDLKESDVRIAGGQRLIKKASPTFADDLYASTTSLAITGA